MIISVVKPVGTAIPNVGHLIGHNWSLAERRQFEQVSYLLE
jgi:hypothetical protein